MTDESGAPGLERVARAITRAAANDATHENLARAAIKAILVPQSDILAVAVKAADNAIQPVISRWYQEEAGYEAEELFASLAVPAALQAMLRAALGDLIDPDEPPEWDAETFARAEHRRGDEVIRPATLRLNPSPKPYTEE